MANSFCGYAVAKTFLFDAKFKCAYNQSCLSFVQSYLFIRFRTFFNLYSNFNIIDAKKNYEMK